MKSTPMEDMPFEIQKNEEQEDAIDRHIFVSQSIPKRWMSLVFLLSMLVGIIAIPFYINTTWYMIVLTFVIAIPINWANIYIVGLQDQGISAVIGKGVMIMIGQIAVAASPDNAKVYLLTWLMLVITVTYVSADLMGDYVVAKKTRTSPISMYIGQIVGLVIGAVVMPGVWEVMKSASPDYGFNESTGAPMVVASSYLGLAQVATTGFSGLPKNCELIFWITLVVMAAMDFGKWITLKFIKKHKRATQMVEDWWPNGMMFTLMAYSMGPSQWFVMAVGWAIREFFEYKKNQCESEAEKKHYDVKRNILASGIIVGAGLWSIVGSFIAIGGADAPFCLEFAAGSPEEVAVWENLGLGPAFGHP